MPDNPNQISKTFCVFPWKQIHVSPVGVVKPCCVFDGALKKTDGSSMIVTDMSAEEMWNSEHLREIRRKMLAGETVPECTKCMEEEKVHSFSDRTAACHYTDDLYRRIEESRASDGRVSELPTLLNLKIGNTCNLKCRMCQPIDSCGIDSEFAKISEKHPRFRTFDNASAFDYYTHDEPVEAMSSWVTRPLAAQNLKELLKNTEHLSLAGGEVTVTAEAMDFLRHCSKTGISKQIDLNLCTNLTKVSDELIELLATFRSAELMCSIDGLGDVLEYIRFPAKWPAIRKNFEKLLTAPPNVWPVVAQTVQIYNILNIAETLEFFEKYRIPKWDEVHFCHLTILFSPTYLSIRNLPKSIKDLALSRIQKFCETSFYFKNNSHFREKTKLLMATLQEPSYGDAEENLSYFYQYTRLLDESRNQKFEECLPELAQLLAAEKITPSYPKGSDGRSFTFHRHKEAGWRYQKSARHEDAVKMFSKALAEDETDSDALFSKGLSLKTLQKLEDAEACFRKLYLLDPGHYYNLVELGLIEKEKSRPDEAMRLFREAKKKEPAEKRGQSDGLIQDCLGSPKGLSKTICPLPWMQMSVAFHTGVRVCCNTDHGGFLKWDDKTPVRLGDISSVNDYINLPEMKHIRKEMMEGRRPEYCQKCYKIEDAGGSPVRPDYLERYLPELQAQLKNTRGDGEITEPKVHLIDFSLSNHCNLKCRMCSPLSSNSLRVDFAKLGMDFNEEEVNLARDGWKITEKFESLMRSSLKDAQEMLTTGGEPFLSDQHRFILRKAIELGVSKNLMLSYHTNLTTLPTELTSLWGHFKKINVNVSIEGFGPLNDYIRYPSQWKKIDANLKKLVGLAEHLPILIQPHTCMQAYSFLQLSQLFDYFKTFNGKLSILPKPILLDYPKYLSIEALPPALRKEGIARLRKYLTELKLDIIEGNSLAIDRMALGNYESFINILNEAPFDPALFEEFIKHTQAFDRLRGQDLPSVAPEFKPFFKASLD